MDIEGMIILELPEQGGVSKNTGKEWKKKEWVLETNGQYPRKVKFTVFGERRIAELNFEMGKSYRISVDVESREYQGRWYTDISAYAAVPVEVGMMGAVAPAQTPSTPPFGQPTAPAFGQSGSAGADFQSPMSDPLQSMPNDTDDLPF